LKRLLKILSASLLIFAVSCTQYSEIPFPDQDSIPVGDEPAIIHLNYKQEITINNKLYLRFEGVGADSRCPVDAVCIWAGDGEAYLTVVAENSSKSYSLHTGLEPREIVVGGYLIQLVNLFPAQKTDLRIRPEDYNIELRVAKITESDIQPVLLIDPNYSGIIRRDAVNASDITLSNDRLNLRVEYGGGCRDHLIELFAVKEITGANPARITLHLSHFADGDLCKALITRQMKFDLTLLKSFLMNKYNIRDRVILNVLDTSGKPLKSGGIEYKF